MKKVVIEESWYKVLQKEFEKEYFDRIVYFLKKEKFDKRVIYPPGYLIFNAFTKTPFHQVKVVILGQDPYHGLGQAHGLSFSVMPPTPPPPSLQNIFKELQSDLQIPIPNHGNIEKWATQGVLLLNASLTVRAAEPMSHSKIGWDTFTNSVIESLNSQKSNIVFILWGKFAQQKKVLVDTSKHYVIESAHPSPLSAYNGFFGSKPFSKTNLYLQQHNIAPIDWAL